MKIDFMLYYTVFLKVISNHTILIIIYNNFFNFSLHKFNFLFLWKKNLNEYNYDLLVHLLIYFNIK